VCPSDHGLKSRSIGAKKLAMRRGRRVKCFSSITLCLGPAQALVRLTAWTYPSTSDRLCVFPGSIPLDDQVVGMLAETGRFEVHADTQAPRPTATQVCPRTALIEDPNVAYQFVALCA
jgi:hypothetical protein